MEPILSVDHVVKTFLTDGGLGGNKKRVHAVNDISFYIQPGEIFSVVGESGCGKSTTGRLINRLITPDSGSIKFKYEDHFRKNMQMIFQDPNASLNPRMRIIDSIAEPLLVHEPDLSKKERRQRAAEMLEIVGLQPAYGERFPHEFSGGQRQRIGIARALTVNPKLVIADEPVSSLDVSIQAQVLNLMQSLQKQYDLTYFFISHDLSVVEMISDTIMVMYLGSIMEISPKIDLYKNPLHPYTRALLSVVPVPDPSVTKKPELLEGDIPSTIDLPVGCPFQTRCPRCQPDCKVSPIPLSDVGNGHKVACLHID